MKGIAKEIPCNFQNRKGKNGANHLINPKEGSKREVSYGENKISRNHKIKIEITPKCQVGLKTEIN